MGKKVGVVGGTGFLGAHLVQLLADAGFEPVVIARRPQRVQEVLPRLGVEARYGDVRNPGSLGQALKGCTYVHCVAGAMGGVFTSPSPQRREAAVRVNVEGTVNVLRAARDARAERVVVTSSCSTRYQHRGSLANEDSPAFGAEIVRDSYVRSKVLEEQACTAFSRGTGLPVTAILPGAMVGPRDTSPTPLGAALLARLNGESRGGVGLEGAFPVVDVRDVARAHLVAISAESPDDAYLVVADTVRTRDWQELFSRVTGIPNDAVAIPPVVAMPMALMFEAISWVRRTPAQFNRNAVRHARQGQQYDCTRARSELGIAFRPLETTVQDTVCWYAANGWITDDARLAIVNSALDRAAYDARPVSLSPQPSGLRA